jgi:hypothetical protein
MNYVRDIFNSIIGPISTSNENNCEVGTNELRYKVKPNFLDQGKTLHREKIKRSEDLISSIRVMNERINNGFINNGFIHNNIEGFGNMTSSKNSADLSDTTTLSNDFDKNIERYNKEYPLFIDETRNYMKLNDRNKNIKDNSSLFTNRDNNFYDITYEKEGCYKSSGGSGLELQTDLNDVSVKTCKMRASDLGYSGFAIRKDPNGNLGCYLSKDISAAKTGGIATKPMTSLAFKTSNSANMGGLLFNGQLGIYNNTIDNNLVTDLTGIEGCDAKNKGVLINEESVVATWGGNCKEIRLKVINSSAWELIGTDSGTGGRPDASFWTVRPITLGNDTYYPIGHTIYTGSGRTVYNSPPRGSMLMVAGDVKDPLSYNPLSGTRGRSSINIKRPVCPPGYVSLGDVVTSNASPIPQGIKCVPADCVSITTSTQKFIWNGLGIQITALYNIPAEQASPMNGYNLFKTNRGNTFYSIKDSCLNQ